MSKTFEKVPDKAKIEKEKEFKVEHLEKQFKEQSEQKGFKAEKHEQKEFKVEHLEKQKIELEKLQVPEKGGKEIAETTQPVAGLFPEPAERAATAVAKQKEGEEKLAKEIDKIKPEKGQVEKIKPEKDNFKVEQKESKIEFKDATFEQEKLSLEGWNKGLAEAPTTRTPAKLFEGTGTTEDRLERLEDVVTRLSHFIGADLRPDLTSGALAQEPDAKTGQSGEESKTQDAPKTKDTP